MAFNQFYKNLETTLETETGSSKITLSGVASNEGLTLNYDLLTATPKQFKIDPTGAHWFDGTTTYDTTLEELSALQQTFQAVELPPNATTLKVVNKVLATMLTDPLLLNLYYFKPIYLTSNVLQNQVDKAYDLSIDPTITLSNDGVMTFPATDTIGPQTTTSIILGSSYSVGFWVNITDLTTNQFFYFFSPTTGNTNRLSFSVTSAGLIQAVQYVGASSNTQSFQTITTGIWYHIVFVANGASWSVYVNGVPNTQAGVILNPSITRNFNYVGRGPTGFNVNGSMTNFFVYNGVVSQARISAIYNNGHLAETDFNNNILLDANVNQITISDGITTNTINKTGYTTKNTTANATHFLDFSDSSSTGVGAIQKTAGLSCNPSTNTITATNLATDNFNSNASYYINSAERIYQTLNAYTGYANSTNGYYGLAKNAYPLPCKNSSGVKAVSVWTQRTANVDTLNWENVCWVPELSLFVAVCSTGTTNRVMTSPDGITWTSKTTLNQASQAICWAPQLGTSGRLVIVGAGATMYSDNGGTTWFVGTITGTGNTGGWFSVCWSPELSVFVAIALNFGVQNFRAMSSPDGINWTTKSTPNANYNWGSVCWSPELGIFCAVGYGVAGNRVITSPDGNTWTPQTTPVDNEWITICWSPELGLFVTLSTTGTSNRVMTSPNGTTWTIGITPTTTGDITWKYVSWAPELGLFCGVGQTGTGNRVMSSPDGFTWTMRTSPDTVGWRGMCWAPEIGLFCAVGNSGTNRVMTSNFKGRPPTSYNTFDSGFNSIDQTGAWTINGTTTNATNVNITSDNTGPGPYYIPFSKNSGTGNKPLFQDDTTGPLTYTPSTATLSATTIATDNLSSNASYYINSSKRIYQTLNAYTGYANSTNGYYGLSKNTYPLPNKNSSGVKAVSVWTQRTTIDNNWSNVCWSPELKLFVAVAGAGGAGTTRAMSSPDGITWTTATTNAIYDWYSVCWSPQLGRFVASGFPGHMYSNNGTTWTPATYNLGSNTNTYSVCWAPELSLFVGVCAGGVAGNRALTSPDGINWSPKPTPATANILWLGVCWSPELGLFVAVAGDGNLNGVMTSPNGTDWLQRTTINNEWLGVCWSPELGLFVAIAGSGTLEKVMTSPDGINWTGRTLSTTPGTTVWGYVCWAPELGLFVAVGQSGTAGNRVMSSPDGITWTMRNTPTTAGDINWRGICWAPELGICCAVSNTGTLNRVMTSSFLGRPPTSYNVFDNDSNRIDQTGNWTITGTITNATNSTITDETADTIFYPTFVSNNTGNQPLKVDKTSNPLSYNPSTGILSATTFSGALSGNATSATTATTATNATNSTITDETADTVFYPTFVSNNTGNQPLKVDKTSNPLSYNPSTGILSAQQLTATTQVNTPKVVNSTSGLNLTAGTGNRIIFSNVSGTFLNEATSATGGSQTIPTLAQSFFRVTINGTEYKIALFNN